MKTSIKLFLAIYFLSLSQVIVAQESRVKSNENSVPVKQNTTANNGVVIKAKASKNVNNSGDVRKQVDTEGKSFQLDENDPYQGRKNEFLSQVILSELPSDFPKYEKWMGVRHYNAIIDEYYKKHLDIVIPSVKQKLTQAHN